MCGTSGSDCHGIVTEYADGGELCCYLESKHERTGRVQYRSFSEPQARFLFQQIVELLLLLHHPPEPEPAYYHGDLKDGNLVLAGTTVKLIDYGSLSKVMSNTGGHPPPDPRRLPVCAPSPVSSCLIAASVEPPQGLVTCWPGHWPNEKSMAFMRLFSEPWVFGQPPRFIGVYRCCWCLSVFVGVSRCLLLFIAVPQSLLVITGGCRCFIGVYGCLLLDFFRLSWYLLIICGLNDERCGPPCTLFFVLGAFYANTQINGLLATDENPLDQR